MKFHFNNPTNEKLLKPSEHDFRELDPRSGHGAPSPFPRDVRARDFSRA